MSEIEYSELPIDELAQVLPPKPQTPYKIHTTMYPIKHLDQSYQIVAHHSPNSIAENILAHNNAAGFTGVLVVGQSGSGKTTMVTMLVHKLHTLAKTHYTVLHFSRNDIQNLHKIVTGLTKAINYILVFDDASFALKSLKKEQLNELAQTLTYIRHIVKGNVITIMNVHYGPAIDKFFRDVPFRLMTSIANEELQQYEDLFGSWAKWKLRDFAKHFHHMMIKGGWRFELSKWDRKVLSYETHKPFRLGLASEVNDLHYFVYHKESCNICDPERQEKTFTDHMQFVEDLYNSYGKKDVNSVLNLYAQTNKGIKTFTTRKQSLFNRIIDSDKINNFNWNDLVNYVKDNSVYKRHRAYIRKVPLADNTNIADLVNPDFRL